MDPTAGGLTVGDRLQRIENRLDQLIASQQAKAEAAELKALDIRLDVIERDGSIQARRAEADVTALEGRVTALETERAVYRALRANRRLVIGTVLGMAGWASAVIAVVAIWHH